MIIKSYVLPHVIFSMALLQSCQPARQSSSLVTNANAPSASGILSAFAGTIDITKEIQKLCPNLPCSVSPTASARLSQGLAGNPASAAPWSEKPLVVYLRCPEDGDEGFRPVAAHFGEGFELSCKSPPRMGFSSCAKQCPSGRWQVDDLLSVAGSGGEKVTNPYESFLAAKDRLFETHGSEDATIIEGGHVTPARSHLDIHLRPGPFTMKGARHVNGQKSRRTRDFQVDTTAVRRLTLLAGSSEGLSYQDGVSFSIMRNRSGQSDRPVESAFDMDNLYGNGRALFCPKADDLHKGLYLGRFNQELPGGGLLLVERCLPQGEPGGSYKMGVLCQEIYYDSASDVLYANCRDSQKKYHPSCLQVRGCTSVSNREGQLVCDDGDRGAEVGSLDCSNRPDR